MTAIPSSEMNRVVVGLADPQIILDLTGHEAIYVMPEHEVIGKDLQIMGRASGEVYARMVVDTEDDHQTAIALNALFDYVKQTNKWSRTEQLLVGVEPLTDLLDLTEL